jgi:hypothetical protein
MAVLTAVPSSDARLRPAINPLKTVRISRRESPSDEVGVVAWVMTFAGYN